MKATERDALRSAHLLRIGGYLDYATLGMWTASPRADVMMGMVEASLKGKGPDEREDALLGTMRALVREAREYYAANDFPAAMGRMRVAQDTLDLRVISMAAE